MLRLELDPPSIDAEIDRLEDVMDTHLEAFTTRAAEDIARFAKREHGYTKRSGNMEENTIAVPASGKFSQETLQAAAVGNTPYAAKLEARPEFAFLEPAWKALESTLDEDLEQAAERASREAGW